jgi:ribulose-bisphosphate carboxylase large chain
MRESYKPYMHLGEEPDPKENVLADFYVESPTNVEDAAAALAAESSTGTWTKVHTASKILQDLSASVFAIDGNNVRVAYPVDLFEDHNIPQVLSDVAGNIFGMKDVDNLRLNDLVFPEKYVKTFPGPKFGMGGVRKYVGTKTRPHVGTIVKPKVGLGPKEHAQVAYDAWTGGLDFVKDDENLTSQRFNPFEDRVIATLEALDKAESETGEKKLYAANITGINMIERGQFVKDHGGKCIMMDILTAGFTGVQQVRDANLGMIIHAHRAMHAAFTRNPKHGMSMLVVAKLARLAGVDQLHIGTGVGKMEGAMPEIEKIREAIEGEQFGLKPVFAVSSGGLHPGMVPALVKGLGNNIVIQAGGGVHWHPKGTKFGAMGLRQAVDAVEKGVSLQEYAKTHQELQDVIDKFGVVE